jgi:hypothetical protein
MARRTRKNSKSVYERIEETLALIAERESELSELRELLEDLYVEKDELEMRETWNRINSIGLNMDDINKLLSDDVLSQLNFIKNQQVESNNICKNTTNRVKKQTEIKQLVENETSDLKEELSQ